jgi:hypothetical protein
MLGLRDLGQAIADQQGFGAGLFVEVLQIMAAQHFVRHDGVEDGLLLAGMEIERARLACVFAEPPAQQFGGGGRDQLVDIGDAGCQAGAELFGTLGQRFGKHQRVVRLDAHGPATTFTTSASKPNTSTTRTQMRRSPALRGTLKLARSITRRASPSFAVLPR